MENVLPVILIAGVIVAGITVAVYAAKKAQQRRDALAALAQRLGWRFHPGNDPSHDDRFAQFSIFRKGHSRRAYNTLAGTIVIDDRTFVGCMGDFRYKVTQQNGKTTTTITYRFSYLLLQPPFRSVPDLLIRPEGLFDKLAGVIGFDDIDFESDEFSRRFHVSSNDKRFAYDVIHPRMMEFLMKSSPFVIELEDGWCCLADGRSTWEPAAFEQNLAWLGRFFDHWPDFLTQDLERGVRA